MALALALGLGLAGCGPEQVATDDGKGKLDACSLLDSDTVAGAVGADSVQPADQSKVLDSPPQSILSCEYAAQGEGPALLFVATQQASQSEAAASIASAQKNCPNATPLTITGVVGFACPTDDLPDGPQAFATWQGFLVHTAIPQSRDRTPAQLAAGLQRVLSKLHDTLRTSSFEPK